MKQYKKISSGDGIRSLGIYTDSKGFEYGSKRFKGQTLDIVLPDKVHIKRVTFGINEIMEKDTDTGIWKSHNVAVTSEILKMHEEYKGDFIDHVLNQTCYENNWD